MIRFLLVNAFIGAYSILLCTYGVVLSIFDRRGGALVHHFAAVPWAKGILWACGVRLRVHGKESLDPAVPRLYVCNHQSYFDIFALLSCLPVPFKFVLKKELMSLPFLGAAMRRAGYISIDREDPRKALRGMNDAAERMKNGASILVFPEGTRSPDGTLQPFKPGAFHLALKSKCQIMPLAIVGSRSIVPKGSLRVQSGTIDLRVGNPIDVDGYSRKDMGPLMEKVREAMLSLMRAPRGEENIEHRTSNIEHRIEG